MSLWKSGQCVDFVFAIRICDERRVIVDPNALRGVNWAEITDQNLCNRCQQLIARVFVLIGERVGQE